MTRAIQSPFKRAIGATAVVAIAALAIAGCGGGGGATTGATSGSEAAGGATGPGAGKTTQVTVGLLPISAVTPVFVGQKQGFFRDEGLTLKTAMAQSGNQLVVGLKGGSYQFSFVGWVPMIIGRGQGLPIKAIANSNGGTKPPNEVVVAGKDSGIESVRDLPGKTIGVNAVNGTQETEIKAGMAKLGVPSSSVKFLEVPFPDMPAAVQAGRVDAAMVSEPFLSALLAKGGRELDLSAATLGHGFPVAGYATSDGYLSEQPDVVKRFARAINRSVDYCARHPKAVRAAIPSFTKVPADVAQQIRLPGFSSKIDRAQLQRLIDYSVKYGAAKKAPSLDDLVWSQAGR